MNSLLQIQIIKHILHLILPILSYLKTGRQKKRWEDNIKEWTGMDFASSTRSAENRVI